MSRVCLVTSEIVGPFKNGGIGTHNYYLMQYLAGISDIECTVVYNGAIEVESYPFWAAQFRSEYDAEFVWISPDNSEILPKANSSCYWERISQANLDYLRTQRFDIILFQEMLGGGFRTIQAKHTLGMFADSLVAVMVHSSWQWVNESMQLFPVYGLTEMLTKYMERYSVEHCDVLVSPSQYMLDWTALDVARTPEVKCILPYLFDPTLRTAAHSGPVHELIFFGRLEQRKGLILFLDSLLSILDRLAPLGKPLPIPVYFLGRPGQTQDGDGAMTIKKYEPLLASGFQLHVVSDLGHHEALEFLRNHPAAMVACPSLQDNSPFAVIENILLGTNLISCRTGGIPELFGDPRRLAEPTVQDLSRLLLEGLSGSLPELKSAYTIERARQAWNKFFSDHLLTSPPPVTASGGEHALQASILATQIVLLTSDTESLICRDLVSRFPDLVILQADCLGGDISSLAADLSPATHLILLADGYTLSPGAEAELLKALLVCPDKILTAFAEYNPEDPILDTPLGPCIEAVLAENCLGTGMLALPLPLLCQLDRRALELMVKAAADPGSFWSLSAHLALASHPMDVVPAKLSTTSNLSRQALPKDAIYSQRSEILSSMSAYVPCWTSRLLPYVIDIAPAYQATSETSSLSASIVDKATRLGLMRRVWRRIKR